LLLLAICTLISLPLVTAGILGAGIVDNNNDNITLQYDGDTYSYADGTDTNQNSYLYLYSDNPAADLLQVDNKALSVTVSLMQIVTATNSNKLDLDLSTGKAYYPGILTFAISDNTGFSESTTDYYALTNVTGLLDGNYGLTVDNDSTSITVRIDNATDSSGNLIEVVKSNIIIGVRNITGNKNFSGSAVTYPGGQVVLAHPGADFEFVINGLVISDFGEDELPITPTTGGGGGGGGADRECNDNRDNDGDGLIDYPTDPGCDSFHDDNETDMEIEGGDHLTVWYKGRFGPTEEREIPEDCVLCVMPEEPEEHIPKSIWQKILESYIYIALLILTLILLVLLGKLMHKNWEAHKVEKNLEELGIFISEQREQGVSDIKIKKDLLDAGWEREVLEEFMNNLNKPKK